MRSSMATASAFDIPRDMIENSPHAPSCSSHTQPESAEMSISVPVFARTWTPTSRPSRVPWPPVGKARAEHPLPRAGLGEPQQPHEIQRADPVPVGEAGGIVGDEAHPARVGEPRDRPRALRDRSGAAEHEPAEPFAEHLCVEVPRAAVHARDQRPRRDRRRASRCGGARSAERRRPAPSSRGRRARGSAS